MCGRFFLDMPPGEIAEHYNEPPPAIYAARYNIAPTTPVLACSSDGLTFFRWGLIPSWARDLSIGSRLFNARAETIAEKPSFRHAFRRRRCLIPASGFYEWRRENDLRQPYCCHVGRGLFSMAGIWEHWQDAEGNQIRSCAVITAEAGGAIRDIHTRMPVMIERQNYSRWLDCRSEGTDDVADLIDEPPQVYRCYPVSTRVNNARNEGMELVRDISIEQSC